MCLTFREMFLPVAYQLMSEFLTHVCLELWGNVSLSRVFMLLSPVYILWFPVCLFPLHLFTSAHEKVAVNEFMQRLQKPTSGSEKSF